MQVRIEVLRGKRVICCFTKYGPLQPPRELLGGHRSVENVKTLDFRFRYNRLIVNPPRQKVTIFAIRFPRNHKAVCARQTHK